MWKAVACTLQIKPCSRHSHANQICRDVCLDILSQCVDWTRLSPVYSAESICENLSPEDPNTSCIKLQSYLSPSAYTYPRVTGQISSPCKGNPCEANEICLIDKDCIHGTNCQPYICQPGCKLGERQNLLLFFYYSINVASPLTRRGLPIHGPGRNVRPHPHPQQPQGLSEDMPVQQEQDRGVPAAAMRHAHLLPAG